MVVDAQLPQIWCELKSTAEGGATEGFFLKLSIRLLLNLLAEAIFFFDLPNMFFSSTTNRKISHGIDFKSSRNPLQIAGTQIV